jgi:hypothetical protein
MERVKPFWLVTVTLIASATIVLAASCGKEVTSNGSIDEDGGTAGKGNGGSGGKKSTESPGSAGTGGSKSTIDSGTLDGATISTGTVQEDEVCALSFGGMGMGMGMGGGQTTSLMSGKCIKTEDSDSCAGGVAPSSDCASGLSCCVNTDACESLSSTIQNGGGAQFGISLKCVTSGSCPAFSFGGGMMGGGGFTPEYAMGCPKGQSCCMSFPDGGIQFPEGGFQFPEGGFNFEGGFPFADGGFRMRDGGFQPPEADAN